MSSLQKLVKKSEEEERSNIKELITSNSLDAAAAQVSASRRNLSNHSFTSTTSSNSTPITNPYYASQSQNVSSNTTFYSSSRGGRGRGRGRGRGGRGRGNSAGRSSSSSGGVPVCKFFRQGRCTAGVDCRFRHTQEAAREGAYNASSYYSPHYNNNGYSGISTKSPKSITIGVDSRTGASMEESNSFGFDDYPVTYTNYSSNRRQYCPVKAAAIQKAKDLQDAEERPYAEMEGPFYSIDVECVAVGYGHTTLSKDRIPGRIAMVDDKGNSVLDEIVRFDDSNKNVVVSYLTPLTGLTKSLCARETNKTFEEIVDLVKEKLPKDAVLVGQSIHHDIEWLGLKQGTDFRDHVDIGLIFRQRIPKDLHKLPLPQDSSPEQNNENEEGDGNESDQSETEINSNNPSNEDVEELPTRYRIFSLRHTCLYLLGVDVQTSFHNPVIDAKYSIDLFNKYRDQPVPALRAARDSLHRAPVTPSFASTNPVIDGVCLTKQGYRYKHAARFIWKWWISLHGGVYGLTPTAISTGN